MKDIQIAPEVADILSRATIKETKLFLPNERLAPPLYKAVNAVIERAGGQWSRRDKAHVFSDDPRERLGLALETGVAKFDAATAAPKLREAHAKKERQAFYTPPELAKQIVDMADVDGKEVLEPSAGEGALAVEMMENGIPSRLVCVEIDRETCGKLCAAMEEYDEAEVRCFDFLTQVSAPGQLFDRVVMNPPFTKNQDVKHVAHALTFLKPGGVLVAIMPNSQGRAAFKALLSHGQSEVTELPAGSFKESGTNASTIVLKIVLPE